MHPRQQLFSALVNASVIGLFACGGPIDDSPPVANGYVHVGDGKVLSGSGNSLWLRGVTFGDWFQESPDPPALHHDARDYERVRAMGMNTVRLFLNYQLLEDDAAPGEYRETGFAWIDQEVEWARAHGVHLVLALTALPGGDFEHCANEPFWEEPEYLDRFVGLWRAIAERYAREPIIAGYALMDDPTPSQTLEQWRVLAERTTAAIREVDPQHMLLVGRGHSIACVFDKVAEESFARLGDPNVLYEFDRMQPWDYVAQDVEFFGLPEYGPYPNQSIGWLHGSWDSRPGRSELMLPPGDTQWTEKHFYYTVNDEKFQYAVPVLQSDNNSGTAYFDGFVINEYDQNGNFVANVMDLDLESPDGWYFWQGDAEGEIDGPGVVAVSVDAYRGNASITLSGTATLANLAVNTNRFNVTLGHTYEVTGWMKGENSDPAGTSAIRIDFWGYKQGAAGLDRAGLEDLFADFVGWGHAQGAPLNVNAFGAGRPAFEKYGGLTYVQDLLDVMIEQDLHFTYYAYHQADFGIYRNPTGLPSSDDVNQPLVDLFTAKLR